MAFNKQDLRVGAPLAFRPRAGDRWDSAPSYSFGWVVKRLTPTGKGVAERSTSILADGVAQVEQRCFQHQGYETEGTTPNGPVKRHGGTFHTDVAACQAAVDQFRRTQNAVSALQAVTASAQTARWTWGKTGLMDEVTKLEALLAAARAAVEAI